MQAGKLGGALARMIDHLLQPNLPWRMLLARYLSSAARDDFSYMRPSRREGDAIFPSLRSAQIDLVIAIDTSGSIKDNEIEEFTAEIDALKGQVRARVTLMACDAQLAEGAPWIFEPWEEIRLPDSFKGGGGTSFRPVFDWIARHGSRPELLVYFTDAQGEFPVSEPEYPVIWLIKGKEKPPWGQRLQLN
jgi:predicted metal-dependent peptidase